MSRDHYDIGRQHSLEGQNRYKFQDPYLQKCYNKGYDGEPWEDSPAVPRVRYSIEEDTRDSLHKYMQDQQNRRKW